MNELLPDRDSKAVIDILVEQLGVKEAQLSPEARLRDDLGADSLTQIEIVMALEERFGICIPDEKTDRISTVQEVFEALAEILSAKDGRQTRL